MSKPIYGFTFNIFNPTCITFLSNDMSVLQVVGTPNQVKTLSKFSFFSTIASFFWQLRCCERRTGNDFAFHAKNRSHVLVANYDTFPKADHGILFWDHIMFFLSRTDRSIFGFFPILRNANWLIGIPVGVCWRMCIGLCNLWHCYFVFCSDPTCLSGEQFQSVGMIRGILLL